MTVSVRMNPLLEKELELAAKRKGVTKSQFVIDAVERALGHKNPYELMLKFQAEEKAEWERLGRPMPLETDEPYDTDASRALLLRKLRAKHGISDAG